MPNKVTLEEVEQLVIQLPSSEQLKLAAHICEQLSATPTTINDKEEAGRERLTQVDAWLAECDVVAESIEGEFDSAEDIRKIRAERTECLALCGCKRDGQAGAQGRIASRSSSSTGA